MIERDPDAALVERIAAIGAGALGVERLAPRVLPRGPLMPDARATFLLHDGGPEPRAVAQLAGASAPEMVARCVARAHEVRAALDAEAAAPVLMPFAEGTLEDRSWAIWVWCRPLAGTTGSWLERRRLADPLHAWLADVTRQTARPAPDDRVDALFARPLARMATQPALSVAVRLAARGALGALDRGAWRPMFVAMHGDLHTGNVLVDVGGATGRADRPEAQRFAVIDWGGARRDGFAVYDLVRLAHALRIGSRRLAARLAEHCDRLGCPVAHAPWHLAAAFADVGDNLEHFPVENYARLADLSFSLLARAGAPIP